MLRSLRILSVIWLSARVMSVADPLSFSVNRGSDAVTLAVTHINYTEHGPPALMCPFCVLSPIGDHGGLVTRNELYFKSDSVYIAINAYRLNVDILEGGYISASIDFVWDRGRGVLTISWADKNRLRSVAELEVALHVVRYSTRGADPTAQGTVRSRTLTVHASIGGVTAHPPLDVLIAIQGRNDAPTCKFVSGAGSSSAVYLEGDAQPIPIFSLPLFASSISDLDDTFATRASAYFPAARGEAAVAGSLPYLLGADVLASYADGYPSISDPSGGLVTQLPYDAALGTLDFVGVAPLFVYAAVLATVGFIDKGGGNPRAGSRAVWARVWDVSSSQPDATPLPCRQPLIAAVQVTPINSAPSLVWGITASRDDEIIVAGAAPAPLFFDANVRLTFTDADDIFVSSILLTISSGCVSGDDTFGYDDAAGILYGLTALHPSPCAIELRGSTPVEATTAAIGRIVFSASSPGPRIITITITDFASRGVLPPSARRANDVPFFFKVRVTPPPRSPVLAALGPLFVVDGIAYGEPVSNGLLLCRDFNDVSAVMNFLVTGGSGVNAFEVGGQTGQLFASSFNPSVATLGSSATVEVTCTATNGTGFGGPPAVVMFTVAIINAGAAAKVAVPNIPLIGAAEGSSPRVGSRPFLTSATYGEACVDVGTAFAPALGTVLGYDVLWQRKSSDAASTANWQTTAEAIGKAQTFSRGHGSDDDDGGIFTDTPVWAVVPVDASGAGPWVCVAGTPRALDAVFPKGSFSASPTSVRPNVTVALIVLAFPLSAASQPLVERAVVTAAAAWPLPIIVTGCRDAAAAYVPCFRGGVALDDASSLLALFSSLPRFNDVICDNACVDADDDGACDNACIADNDVALFPWGCSNGPISTAQHDANTTSAAANPGGNWNVFATLDGGAPAAACVLPPRVMTTTLTLPLAPAALAAWTQVLFELGSSTGDSHQSLGAPTSLPPAALTPGALSNSPNLRVALPPIGAGAMPAKGIELETTSPTALAGAAALFLPHGALDAALAHAALSGSLGDFSRFTRPNITVSVAFSLNRVAWPTDEPLPPLSGQDFGSLGRSVVIDVRSLFRPSPAGLALPSATPAEICIYAGRPAAAHAAAWAADPAARRIPILLGAPQAIDGEAPFAFAADRRDSAAGWLPSEGYGAWQVLPLSRAAAYAGVAGAAADGASGGGGRP